MLAATRLIALHKNKGMTVAACLKNRTDYIENPDKTEQGQYVSSYACSALTSDEEFMLTKRQYDFVNGRRQKSDVIAYQVRQSFRPGEVTPEEANKIGYEFAERFLKGKHAFIVATHTDRAHIHNHIIYNSTALDGTRKFRDFYFSALAVQRLSDLICLDENRQLKSKADMFTKRTIRPERVVTSVDTPSEALAVSIGEHGKVDLPYMAKLLGTPGEYGRITTELSGVIFKDPAADADDPEAGWQTADEYLSGNVRDSYAWHSLLRRAHPEFKVNVDALTKAQPKDLEASEIDLRLGATWLDPSIVQQFMMETFQPPYRIRYNNAITVRYSPYTSEWRISNKSATGFGDIMATETYGTRRANAYKILEDTLNLRDSRVL
mgnify:CR=1 FL=1